MHTVDSLEPYRFFNCRCNMVGWIIYTYLSRYALCTIYDQNHLWCWSLRFHPRTNVASLEFTLRQSNMEVWQPPKNVGFTWHFELFKWMISPNHSQRVRRFLPCLFRAAWGYCNDPVAYYGNAQHPSVLKKILKRKVQLIFFYLNSFMAVYKS